MLPERISNKIDASGPCWLWLGCCKSTGYGRVSYGGIAKQAHRLVYELLVGPIPPGLVLDHLCKTRNCVNPDHLEPVTQAENTRRGVSYNGSKTHCKHGHPYDEANTYVFPSSGWRQCRACARAASLARHHANKENKT